MSEIHVVALSGGKDSTALALRLAELHPDWNFMPVCTPTGDEPPEMIQHWVAIGRLVGAPLQPITCGLSLDGLIRKQNALPNWRQRWCTRMLKIEPYAAFLGSLVDKYEKVYSHVGLRADEEEREGGDYSDVPGVEMRFDMREWGWGLDDVLAYLRERGVTIPKRTDCLKCFYQRLIEWWEFWKEYPDSWAEGEALEELTGHTFRSPGRDTWPASMKGLRERFEAGAIPRDTRRDPLNEMKCRVCKL